MALFAVSTLYLFFVADACETTNHIQKYVGKCNLIIDTCSSYHHFKIHWDATARLTTGESAASNGWQSQTGSVDHSVQDLFRNLHGCNCETFNENQYGCALEIRICFNFNKADQDVSANHPQYEVWATYPQDTSVTGYYCCGYDRSQSIQAAVKKLVAQKSCITTKDPTNSPTNAPSNNPSNNPTNSPTNSPTKSPTNSPTNSPTKAPIFVPTNNPSNNPSNNPTNNPTQEPTNYPTTNTPIIEPTYAPTEAPTHVPSSTPTKEPTHIPTAAPTIKPTKNPTVIPTNTPTNKPILSPTNIPTADPTNSLTNKPTNFPTNAQTSAPSVSLITDSPSKRRTYDPSIAPTNTFTQSATSSDTQTSAYSTTIATVLDVSHSIISNIFETSHNLPNMPHKSEGRENTKTADSMTVLLIIIGCICVLLCFVPYAIYTARKRKQSEYKDNKFNLLIRNEVQITDVTMLCDNDGFRCGFKDN